MTGRRRPGERKALLCPYCDRPVSLVTGRVLYPHFRGAWEKPYWFCAPCKAWVGCHDGTQRPLGRLADAELRRAKQAVHAAFDPLWEAKMRRDGCSKGRARGAGYKWLAEKLGIDRKRCHVGMFDVATCLRAVEICSAIGRRG